jgi:murein L,D-transpeptidase YafK
MEAATRSMNKIAGHQVAIVAAAVAAFLVDHAAWGQETCKATDRRLVVLTAEGRLLLCDRTNLVGSFGVHLGRGGVGKTRAGDNKVPTGVYPLGEPRKSDKFWIFIPIGYPTPEQRRKGYTGQDVGVHGPHRYLRWLGPLTNIVSSTAGCIGLGKNEHIEQVSAWVKSVKVKTIEIR